MENLSSKGLSGRWCSRLAVTLGALMFLPGLAQARSCGDPAVVAAVLRLLSDRLGLDGSLTLDQIHRVPTDPATGGPTCEAQIQGIKDGPVMLGRPLSAVRYWDEIGPSIAEPSVAARLMPRSGPPAAPSLVDATSIPR